MRYIFIQLLFFIRKNLLSGKLEQRLISKFREFFVWVGGTPVQFRFHCQNKRECSQNIIFVLRVVYHEILQTSKEYMRDITVVSLEWNSPKTSCWSCSISKKNISKLYANLFARTDRKASWLAGDKHWRHHHPITFTFSLFTKRKHNRPLTHRSFVYCL